MGSASYTHAQRCGISKVAGSNAGRLTSNLGTMYRLPGSRNGKFLQEAISETRTVTPYVQHIESIDGSQKKAASWPEFLKSEVTTSSRSC